MYIPLTPEQARTLHPEHYQKMQEEKDRSKAKSAKIPLEQFTFRYDVSERIDGSKLDPTNWDKYITGKRARMKTHLVAFKGSYHLYQELPTLPNLVIETLRKGFDKRQAEQKRLCSLTPAQRQQEILDALRQLAGSGFIGVNLDPKMTALAKKAGVRVIKPKA